MSIQKTKAVIYAKRNEPLFLDEISIPEPKEDQAIVKIIASGICGSQLHDLTHPKIALPRLLGHEATGIVVKKGKLVTHVEEGDHVLISWIPYDANVNAGWIADSGQRWIECRIGVENLDTGVDQITDTIISFDVKSSDTLALLLFGICASLTISILVTIGGWWMNRTFEDSSPRPVFLVEPTETLADQPEE